MLQNKWYIFQINLSSPVSFIPCMIYQWTDCARMQPEISPAPPRTDWRDLWLKNWKIEIQKENFHIKNESGRIKHLQNKTAISSFQFGNKFLCLVKLWLLTVLMKHNLGWCVLKDCFCFLCLFLKTKLKLLVEKSFYKKIYILEILQYFEFRWGIIKCDIFKYIVDTKM